MSDATNVILIQSDNHNRDVSGCYGHPVVRTPNIDRIAAAGVRFTRAYASSALCCPSRASLACGRFPHETGYWDNCLVYDGARPSWMRRLRDAGHTVVSVGKLHFRSTEDDNGFSRELAPMHIVDGVGGLPMLLRWSGDEPAQLGQYQMYANESGVGTSDYQDYDREITRLACQWLREEAPRETRPWVLYVSYTSSHPPFSVPERLWNQYPWQEMPLPCAFRPGERLEHPALTVLREGFGAPDLSGPEHEATLRRVAAGYFGLITHLDEQVGEVLDIAEDLGMTDTTRTIYTSDHGEAFGNQGLFGKCQLLESAIAVPLIASGPGIPAGALSSQMASHVDLYPTLIEALGEPLPGADASLPGSSLWPALTGAQTSRTGFAEFHAAHSLAGSFMVREGDEKLIYHVGMPPQLFDLAADPPETRDLAAEQPARVAALEARLREICDPEAVDARCKADQKARVMEFGGNAAVLERGIFVRTPPPGGTAIMNPM